MKHVLAGTATAVLTGLLLSGCGGSSHSASGHPSSTSTGSVAGASHTPSPTATTGQASGMLPQHGLVLVECGGVGDATVKLVGIDPGTRHVAGTITMPASVPDKTFGDVALAPGGTCGG